MSIGTAIFLSTVLILAYRDRSFRNIVLWVLGVVFIVFIAFVIWAVRR